MSVSQPLFDQPLFDTHAHLISGDWDRYQPKAFSPDLPTPPRTDFTVTVEALIAIQSSLGS